MLLSLAANYHRFYTNHMHGTTQTVVARVTDLVVVIGKKESSRRKLTRCTDQYERTREAK
jgi:hypothetical protein